MPDRSALYHLYEQYAGGVAYVEVEYTDGRLGIGTAFHIGNGVYVTARHVVEGTRVRQVATTVPSSAPNGLTYSHTPGVGRVVEGPIFHPDPAYDIAVFRVAGIDAPALPIASFHPMELPVLTPVLLMGYPPIPFSKEPVLVAATAEVSAVVESYCGAGPHLILTSMARGGLSGGVALAARDVYDNQGTLGIVTRSLTRDSQPEELGYLAVLPLEIITSNCHGTFHSRLDWYLSPGREEAAWRTVRGQITPDEV